MSQPDTKCKEYIIIHEDGRIFRGFCTLGNPEWTKKMEFAKVCQVNEAVEIQLTLKNKGYNIFVDNFEKHLPVTEV